MRALILGCGYVGMELGEELARRGHEVSGVRRSGSADAELKARGILPLQADVADRGSLSRLPAEWDWVVHCASSSGGGPEEYRRVYLEGMANLNAWLSAKPPAKLVYTSSTGVYGQTDGSVVDETGRTDPLPQTARILSETEQVIFSAFKDTGFPAVVLRVAGIYGPSRGHYLKQFLGGAARIEGEKGRFLNMIHRDDVAGCILAALERGRPGQAYNAVDDEPVTQRDFFGWLAAQLGRPLPPTVADDPDAARKRGVTNKRVSNRKLKTELGYAFKYPTFREGYAGEVERWRHELNSAPGTKSS